MKKLIIATILLTTQLSFAAEYIVVCRYAQKHFVIREIATEELAKQCINTIRANDINDNYHCFIVQTKY